MTPTIDLDAINGADDRAAQALLLPFIERSPEVAARAARRRPFADAPALAAALRAALFELTEAETLELFRGHPELAPPAPDEMTPASQTEQGRLGLTDPAAPVAARLAELNRRYRARFGFPYIVALHRHADLESVLANFERRLDAAREDEIAAAREEIASVCRARVLAASEAPAAGSNAGGVSIHAVDVASGRPAEGLEVRLIRVAPGDPAVLAEGRCGQTGLFDHPTVQGEGIEAGRYLAEFEVGAYFRARGGESADAGFLETVRYDFGVPEPAQHYHLPFKFTAWGYSLFRGGL
ncbi:2-oxo-4-hydroxy-4-carboxy-5-ureidoimidazoline decarboxylase [Albimonas sp. CAU 1670]|uniref:2-oxo-4-hydroxy-4-carboxy-5-ureidoimidazoline decarboxylase n=1 Tax=Albimonas sp. CAU 1670 TaxID=3032599 RepID=UPI0023DC3687|nr:2-oxo-4-hydroxy-4-carboxy-5-ureidoimidazoline decarboxylase [Albimonas sp. CAU 1670]MDF2235141.1 2-oxo-4-hydroxy-4-carboxy-5-ureidoimidazoline decarboxylase [Albimonas sp. CAU 1670]